MELVFGFILGSIVAAVVVFLLVKQFSKLQESRFQVLASEILEKNTGILKVQNEEQLTSLVKPFNERVKEYRDYLEQMHKFDLQDRESLREKLNQMLHSAQKIETEAGQLTRALTSDVKFQGAWGELTLEKILELAGLNKGQEYFTQEVLKDHEGQVSRPDVIIKLPNDSSLVIDSKVSLSAYFDYVNEQNSEALKKLKTSVVNHIDSLSKKKYHNLDGLNSPDFIYLFIPVEGVYALMLKEFPEIIDEALKKNIILVSPVNLMANLKTVASLWRLEKQSRNAQVMAQKAGAMYDKFVSILDDIEKMGSSLTKAQSIQEDLVKKISTGKGNLMNRAEELKALGAKTSKETKSNFLN